MKQVKYVGDQPVHLTTLGVLVKNGDVIPVPDNFQNANFEEVKPKKPEPQAKEGDK